MGKQTFVDGCIKKVDLAIKMIIVGELKDDSDKLDAALDCLDQVILGLIYYADDKDYELHKWPFSLNLLGEN